MNKRAYLIAWLSQRTGTISHASITSEPAMTLTHQGDGLTPAEFLHVHAPTFQTAVDQVKEIVSSPQSPWHFLERYLVG